MRVDAEPCGRFLESSELYEEAQDDRNVAARRSEASSTEKRRASRRAEELKSCSEDRLMRLRSTPDDAVWIVAALRLSRERMEDEGEGFVIRDGCDWVADESEEGVGECNVVFGWSSRRPRADLAARRFECFLDDDEDDDILTCSMWFREGSKMAAGDRDWRLDPVGACRITTLTKTNGFCSVLHAHRASRCQSVPVGASLL